MAIRLLTPAAPGLPELARRLRFAARRTHSEINRRRDNLRGHGLGRLGVAQARALHAEADTAYIALIELICDAANIGIESWMEPAFSERRGWFIRHFRQVRPFVAPHLSQLGAAPDSFETLFLPERLSLLLASDNGTLIGRLCATQDALASWGSELARSESRPIVH